MVWHGYGSEMMCLHVFDYNPDIYNVPHPQLAWIVVFVATLLLGVDLGLITGVVFSLLLVLIRTAL